MEAAASLLTGALGPSALLSGWKGTGLLAHWRMRSRYAGQHEGGDVEVDSYGAPGGIDFASYRVVMAVEDMVGVLARDVLRTRRRIGTSTGV